MTRTMNPADNTNTTGVLKKLLCASLVSALGAVAAPASAGMVTFDNVRNVVSPQLNAGDTAYNTGDAFTEAGERLLARDQAQPALEAYTKARNIRPHDHAVLHGLVAAHSKLGAPDEAAAVLEQAVADRPRDVELRAMLSRAYLDAEDATAAERATVALVELEASNYPQLFEVARLYLQRGDTNATVSVLSRATEPALAKRQEQKLLGLLNEALARDPEQIEALRLLLRIYTWQRDDDHMRVTLERLAEAAQTHNLVGEERRALEHLIRLVPFDQSYHERLSELGEAEDETEGEADATWYEPPLDAAPPAPEESPAAVAAFDDMIERGGGDNAFHVEETSPANISAPGGGGAVEFEWNSVAMPEPEADELAAITIDPSSSFADLNEDLDDMTTRSSASVARAAAFGAGDLSIGGAFDDSALAPDKGTGDGRVKMMLAQELESVDYYLAQGYADIARDTLDMLERQYGQNEEISRRRHQLAHEDEGQPPPQQPDSFVMPFVAAEASAAAPAEFETFALFESFAPVEATETDEVELGGQLFVAPLEEFAPTVVDAPPAPVIEEPRAASPPPLPQTHAPGLHPDLADMFDEFRDEVEADSPPSTGDYETHYNTALAYREMGLVDQAVEELQAAIALAAPRDGTPRYLQCCNLLGHCFMQKNMPHPAAMWFRKGLDAPEHTEDEYQALRYELGTAYEQMGDLERAIEIFSEVYGTDVNYRGVAAKLRDLQAQKA